MYLHPPITYENTISLYNSLQVVDAHGLDECSLELLKHRVEENEQHVREML